MPKKVAFLHTFPTLVTLFNQLSQIIFPPDVEVFHIVDEMLLKIVLAQGGLSPFIHRRVAEHAIAVEAGGVDLLQITCSSISPCVDSARPLVGIPVLRIDEPMVEKAISTGIVIGVCATASTTLKPTTELVLARALAAKKDVQVEPVLCAAAYTALFAGDQHTHDLLVREAIFNLTRRTDVVILAQASMARVLDSMDPSELKAPVLTSPRLALERALELLG